METRNGHLAQPANRQNGTYHQVRSARPCRIAIYSHDTMGLGHVRRNVFIAHALKCCPFPVTVLLIAGTREAGSFALPAGADCLILPSLHKQLDGTYACRHLGLALNAVVALRSRGIRAALESFEPDVLIVDNVPRGAVRELDPTLAMLRLRGRTRCVLGLRDVLDDPEAVRREWVARANQEAIRDYYDAVWVYGDQGVFDLAREYSFAPAVAAKLTYAGYLDQRLRLVAGVDGASCQPAPGYFDPCKLGPFGTGQRGELLASLGLPPGRLAVCLVGGGQDGAALAESFAVAPLQNHTNGLLLTGPFMPREVQDRLRRMTADNPRFRILDFVPEPNCFLCQADHVVAMGGYNTICEVLSFEKRALIVPRVRPRREQWIRAERMRALGMLDVLHPDDLTPGALGRWLAGDPKPPFGMRDRVDLQGAARLPQLLEELLPEVSLRATPRVYAGT